MLILIEPADAFRPQLLHFFAKSLILLSDTNESKINTFVKKLERAEGHRRANRGVAVKGRRVDRPRLQAIITCRRSATPSS